MNTVSIIVPVYKVEKYLHRCVDSILAQTFTDFELILVDDESPDNCPTICDEYAEKDDRIRAIHKKNGGGYLLQGMLEWKLRRESIFCFAIAMTMLARIGARPCINK